jgi:hypothetical protein
LRIALAGIAAAALAAADARADDRAAALDAPAPPTLPALVHPTLVDTFEITIASIDPGKGSGRAYAWFLHDEIEYPIVSRVFYVGAAHDVVSGAVPGQGRDFFFGAPEVWTRAVWSSVIGLKSGGGLGVVLPAPRDLTASEAVVFDTVRVVRPWDAAYFTDQTVTLRPWIDVGHAVGRFTLQLRQGLDVAIVARALHKDERRTDLTARTTFYAGFRLAQILGVGLEIWETYAITADLPDDRRAAFAVSPSVRLMLGRVAPAFSLLLPIATPLRGDAASYVAARFNVGFAFDAGRRKRD